MTAIIENESIGIFENQNENTISFHFLPKKNLNIIELYNSTKSLEVLLSNGNTERIGFDLKEQKIIDFKSMTRINRQNEILIKYHKINKKT